jgi:hypothetical protein
MEHIMQDDPNRDEWKKPTATEGDFQRTYGYEHATVIKWGWSGTFGRWGATVRFDDGTEYYTWPRPVYRQLPDVTDDTLLLETIYAVLCPVHGVVSLTNANYAAQLGRPDTYWFCPICGPGHFAHLIEPYEREDYS